MKARDLTIIIISLFLLNPRLEFKGFRDSSNYIISCSTGWSLHIGKGEIAIYSLESATSLKKMKLLAEKKISSANSYNEKIIRKKIMLPCR